MKQDDQIKSAQEMIKYLQDYIELAKVQKKLKDDTNKANIESALNHTIKNINANISNL